MTEDLYTEKLNWFKQNEKPEAVLLMADNPDLVKIVIAWASAVRAEIYTRIGQSAEEHGIELSICACKNPDLAHGTCNIGGNWPKSSESDDQLNLFDQGN